VSCLRSTAACALAWLVPGAGHLYLRRPLKAALFFFLVLATFSIGLALHGRVYAVDNEQPLLSALATFANVSAGPLDLIGRTATYRRLVYRLPEEDNPQHDELMALVRGRVLRPTYEYGTTFILTAGLMNILLILDVFDICIGRKD
jgi:hypothetical protein